VIVNGNLQEAQSALAALASGAADVVAIGRGALAQRDWPRRVREGLDIATDPRVGTIAPLADIKDWELSL
jgi:2,4-dienoyl-CoA reductase-like NADH-dependent reductase (Old Yellow Enzyme family)